ncbi:MAG: hypothetical protein Q9183_001011 [Haloplaca sp. 2 TL-2023]
MKRHSEKTTGNSREYLESSKRPKLSRQSRRKQSARGNSDISEDEKCDGLCIPHSMSKVTAPATTTRETRNTRTASSRTKGDHLNQPNPSLQEPSIKAPDNEERANPAAGSKPFKMTETAKLTKVPKSTPSKNRSAKPSEEAANACGQSEPSNTTPDNEQRASIAAVSKASKIAETAKSIKAPRFTPSKNRSAKTSEQGADCCGQSETSISIPDNEDNPSAAAGSKPCKITETAKLTKVLKPTPPNDQSKTSEEAANPCDLSDVSPEGPSTTMDSSIAPSNNTETTGLPKDSACRPAEDNVTEGSGQVDQFPKNIAKLNEYISETVVENTAESPKVKNKPKPARKAPAKADNDKIIVGVDFGTTYSGLCWARIRTPETQTPVHLWPDSISRDLEGKSNEKVPTELLYTKQGYKWGFEIPSNAGRLQWFKLGLDIQHHSETSLSRDYPDENAALPDHDQTPERLVEDYLTALRTHFEAVLQCAERAGMGEGDQLQLISEPEAAAIYALQQMRGDELVIGDTFVLCDAGGGTVDLISYKIEQVAKKMRIVEVARGDGRQCGSTFLDRRFKAHLQEKLGKHRAWNEDMLEEAMKRFENETKRMYDGSLTGEPFDIPVPGFSDDPELGIRRSRFQLSRPDLFEIFDPVMKQISSLVTKQIVDTTKAGSKVKAIVMVGGFGENVYLRKRLLDLVREQGIEVWRAPEGWTAVVRGALLKGLSEANARNAKVAISGRVARSSHGTDSAKPFDTKLHPPALQYWSDANQRYEIDTYDWFIYQGETIKEKKPIRLPYHTEQPVKIGPLRSITVSIVRYFDHEDHGPPLFVEETSEKKIELIAKMKVPLHKVSTKSLQKRRSEDGKEWWIIDFALKVTCMSGETIYELMHNKRNLGRVTSDDI